MKTYVNNTSYHSVRKKMFPQALWNKEKIIQWTAIRRKLINKLMIKHILLKEVEFFTDCKKYVINKLAKENIKIVLRLLTISP